MRVGYARTSTIDEPGSLERQKSAIVVDGRCDVFEDQNADITGPLPQRDAAFEKCGEGDTLVVAKADRIAANMQQLSTHAARLAAKGVTLRILDFGGSAVDIGGKFGPTLATLAALAKFERATHLERQRIGVAKAKLRGSYKGRAPTARSKSDEIISHWERNERPDRIAELVGVSRASVYRVLRDHRHKTAQHHQSEADEADKVKKAGPRARAGCGGAKPSGRTKPSKADR